MKYQPVSCLNIVNLFVALCLWALIIWGASCIHDAFSQDQKLKESPELYAPDDTLVAWNNFFSKEGSFLIVGDTCFVRGDSVYWWVSFFVSTGDPDNVFLWREEWSRHIEEDGLPKSKGNNPLRL